MKKSTFVAFVFTLALALTGMAGTVVVSGTSDAGSNNIGSVSPYQAQSFQTIAIKNNDSTLVHTVWVDTVGAPNVLRTVNVVEKTSGKVIASGQIPQGSDYYTGITIQVDKTFFPGENDLVIYAVADGYNSYDHVGETAGVYVGYLTCDQDTVNSDFPPITWRTVLNGSNYGYLYIGRSSEVSASTVHSGQDYNGQGVYLAGYHMYISTNTTINSGGMTVTNPEVEVDVHGGPVILRDLCLVNSLGQVLKRAEHSSYRITPDSGQKVVFRGDFTLPSGEVSVFLVARKVFGAKGTVLVTPIHTNTWVASMINQRVFNNGDEMVSAPSITIN
jgi:hypothetical protein